MNQIDHLTKHIPLIEEQLGYSFKNKSLLLMAFVHRSFVNEFRAVGEHNERLEFLGDSVLGVLIAEHLYLLFSDLPEGDLSYLRSRLVEAHSCVQYLQILNISSFVLLGKGERLNDGRGRETIFADLLEAIIGAIYLDGGLEAAKTFLFSKFGTLIHEIIKTPLQNWKAQLQDYCQKKFQRPPSYVVLEETGPDHNKIFLISVTINDTELGRGAGASKKEAQQEAAKIAYLALPQQESD